ncbi:hypothetical protein I5677_09510 [Mobilitalea sibirica]|uniref:Uncharacterized protein n=1 Tax=Mobilitalea sibirica TaxID=1462919 RepID=A0A8J7HBI2_9FIRM|nr:hypothetical protein [Mobilitalea sibirica]MBH1941126.1 hypothetical protein [Mobilitalea sibirica]
MQYRWIYHTGITPYEYDLFIQAVGSNIQNYKPIAVAHQDDLRYRFFIYVNGGPDIPTSFNIIEIYKPIAGIPYITRILPINVDL